MNVKIFPAWCYISINAVLSGIYTVWTTVCTQTPNQQCQDLVLKFLKRSKASLMFSALSAGQAENNFIACPQKNDICLMDGIKWKLFVDTRPTMDNPGLSSRPSAYKHWYSLFSPVNWFQALHTYWRRPVLYDAKTLDRQVVLKCNLDFIPMFSLLKMSYCWLKWNLQLPPIFFFFQCIAMLPLMYKWQKFWEVHLQLLYCCNYSTALHSVYYQQVSTKTESFQLVCIHPTKAQVSAYLHSPDTLAVL